MKFQASALLQFTGLPFNNAPFLVTKLLYPLVLSTLREHSLPDDSDNLLILAKTKAVYGATLNSYCSSILALQPICQ